MKNLIIFLVLLAFCSSFSDQIQEKKKHYIHKLNLDSLFKTQPQYISDGFDFPVGKPDAKGYYNAQVFGANNHLGDDWNGLGGGDSDLGDPIFAISNGYVTEVKNYGGGWGKVLRIVHSVKGQSANYYLESIYAHCDSILVKEGTCVFRGNEVASIGNCNGSYHAHLHLELRNELDKDIGGGYAPESGYHLDPSEYILYNRPKH